jgi:hypothetical protein
LSATSSSLNIPVKQEPEHKALETRGRTSATVLAVHKKRAAAAAATPTRLLAGVLLLLLLLEGEEVEASRRVTVRAAADSTPESGSLRMFPSLLWQAVVRSWK